MQAITLSGTELTTTDIQALVQEPWMGPMEVDEAVKDFTESYMTARLRGSGQLPIEAVL